MITKQAEVARKTVFKVEGFKQVIANLIDQTQQLYLSDEIPWVVGYSGGKDSTAILQLVWAAISALPKQQHHKPVHVISTDTLVENPIVSLWVSHSLKHMDQAVKEQGMPIHPHRLTPEVQDRFWVNLIGKGYPAPRPKFRWCTSRLKISPSNNFIQNVVKQNGEAILVLGTRKAESSTRAASMKKYEKTSTRELLSSNQELDRVWVYTPIATWTNDDVWQYLMQVKNPWGYRNEDLLGMYSGATEDGECPLVVDTSTPSCGDSRFGCYVCTMVSQDKSMSAMIQNDIEKEWMAPLLDFRNKWLDFNGKGPKDKIRKLEMERQHRDFRRIHGGLTLYRNQLVHGPYKQSYREQMLEALLKAQVAVREIGPVEVKDMELITLEELEEIRRIWLNEKHEIEDNLPVIYQNATGKPYPGKSVNDGPLQVDELKLLEEICQEQETSEDNLHYQMIRELLHIEHQHRAMARRSTLYTQLDSALSKYAFSSEKEAQTFSLKKFIDQTENKLRSMENGTSNSTEEKELAQNLDEARTELKLLLATEIKPETQAHPNKA